MKDAVIEHVRVGARGAKFGWKSACVSAAMVLAVGCGGDDGGSSNSDGNTDTGTGTKDASTAKPDASTAKPDASSNGSKDAGSGTTTETGDATNGKKITSVCTVCHGTNFAGAGYYPNITPDKTTGIGNWTDDEISNAFNNGINQDGSMLCSLMVPYGFNDSDTADVLAFLRSLAPVSKDITMECPVD